jgi:3',5'-cyclic AMP phosphodiesterase CpdA
MDELLADGFGAVVDGPGEAHLVLTLDDAAPPADGAAPVLLTRFVHLADIQLTDDESPARFAALDLPGLGAFRPQEGHGCRILNAAVRTINALATSLPIDFVLLGGDNVDNAQQNEHAWLLAALRGDDALSCDSGKNDDPIAGPDNDPKDPFVAEGLALPWLWVTGNHDVLRQGLTAIGPHAAAPLGSEAAQGTRDWSLPGAPVVKGDVPADPARAFLDVDAMLKAVMADGDHGIDDAVIARGKASYVRELAPGLRLMVLDTATPLGGAEGVILQSDVDGFIAPALDAARDAQAMVIITTHHSSNTLADGSDGGPVQPGALGTDAWQAFVASYDNVLMLLAGHSHIHRVHRRAVGVLPPFWEVITSALADYPHQMRVVEIWDRDNGALMTRMTSLDYATEGDVVAADGRARGVVDYTSGWAEDGRGAADDRNVELYVPKPSGW